MGSRVNEGIEMAGFKLKTFERLLHIDSINY